MHRLTLTDGIWTLMPERLQNEMRLERLFFNRGWRWVSISYSPSSEEVSLEASGRIEKSSEVIKCK